MTAASAPERYVPHRPPILCLRAVLAASATEATAEGRVEAPHAPDGAQWEGGLIEGLAQTAAALRPASGAPRPAFLVGLSDFDVLRRPRVGELVRYTVTLERNADPFVLARGEARCGDEVVARGGLKFFMPPEGRP